MSLSSKSSDLKRRMQEALRGGGDKAIQKQKATGKLTARERIIALLDAKSFHEYDLFVEHAGRDFETVGLREIQADQAGMRGA